MHANVGSCKQAAGARIDMLKAKHDRKVNRKELLKGSKEQNLVLGLRNERKGRREAVLGWRSSLEVGWGMRCQGFTLCPSVSALLLYALLYIEIIMSWEVYFDLKT